MDIERERAEFERAVRQHFEHSEFSFSRAPDGYFNAVGNRARSDLREYAPVSMLWSIWQAARAERAEAARPVYLVATGETHGGQETYTRHEGAPPPLCDSERLFAAPVAEAAQRVPQWQPIETAPHDEVVMLGWRNWDGEWRMDVCPASWGWSTPSVGNTGRHGQATHWRPLPEPPATEPEGEQP